MRLPVLLLVLLPLIACTEEADDPLPGDGGSDAGLVVDAGDSGPKDLGALLDAGPTDTGAADSGPSDSGLHADATFPDATIVDATVLDASPTDAGTPDLGSQDSGGPRTPASGQCIRNGGNGCVNDDGCLTGGCGGEYCGEKGVITTCDCTPPVGVSCGCVNNTCTWYR